MIYYNESQQYFHLQTQNTSYVIKILPSLHLGHIFYGDRLEDIENISLLETKFAIEVGNQVIYDEADKTFNLNLAMLEASTYGKGDFRDPMLHIRYEDGSRITDLKYLKHQILELKPSFPEMPETFANQGSSGTTLQITLADANQGIEVDLYYSLFESADVITRRMVIRNGDKQSLIVEKAMSMNLDLMNQDYRVVSLDGAWIRERQITEHHLQYGILKIDSKKGVSSNDHNPFIAIKEPSTDEEFGRCYGFSLIYSGNFEASVEVSPHQIVRILMGVNSFDFYYPLSKNQKFVTPEVVLSYSKNGLSRLSQNFHQLVKKKTLSRNNGKMHFGQY